MKTYHFTYTNKPRIIRSGQAFFILTFFIATGYIITNIQSFWKTHPIQIVILFLIICGVVIPMLLKKDGRESKEDITLSDDVLIIGDMIRIPLQSLQLDSYHSEELNHHCYHLSSSGDQFTLYTNQKDDLISHLLGTEIRQHSFTISDYQFKRSSEVFIETENNRSFYFDLDSGKYAINGRENQRTAKLFIQTPGFKKA